MKKFSFSLDKVLDYKKQLEDNLRTKHAVAVREVIKKEEQIAKMEMQHQSFVEKLEETKKTGCRIEDLILYQGYLSTSSQRIKEEKEQLELLRKHEEEARGEVIEAKKGRTSIDMLKDKKIQEYNFYVQKEEERFIEEFVANNRSQACSQG